MAERRERLEELFYAALECQPGERDSFLAAACAADPGLKAEVESLISAHERPGSFLDSPAVPLAAEVLADVEARFLAGQTIGHYEVLALVGRGGMGEVYLARDTRLDRKVALKLLPRHYTADEIRLRRFVLEARAASSLNHPNILTIHEIGQVDEAHFIATEFIVGQTLRQRMAGQPMALRDALDIAIQVAGALAVAHEAGIMHRDIKPENLMVRPDGYVKVLDFGLAKLAEQQRPAPDSKDTTALKVDTDPGTVMGTTRYMSPEQARGLEVDARSDIFSLGVVIYEMIAGRPPFTGETRADVSASILKTEPAPLADFASDTPAALQRIVSRALSKEKEQRHQTSDEVLSDLKALKQELESAPKPVTPAPRWIFYLRPVLLILLAAVLIGIAWWSLKGFRNQSEADRLSSLRSSLSIVPLASWKTESGEGNSSISVSPDGSMIAYAAKKGGQTDIWIRPIAGGEPTQVTKDKWIDDGPIWSPDGQKIAFFSDRNNQNGIWTVAYLDGTPTLLRTLDAINPILRRWSKDGMKIYYELQANFFAFGIASGETTQITNFDSTASKAINFDISADETWLVYSGNIGGQWHIWAMPMRGGAPLQVTRNETDNDFPRWFPDGNRIAYSSRRDGIHQICVAYLDGRASAQITFGESNVYPWSVSPDGRRIIFISPRDESDVFWKDIDTGEEIQLTSDIRMELWPDVAPDGRTVAFQKTDTLANLLNSQILARPIQAEAPAIELAADGFDPRWSPDGSRLAFLRRSGDLYNVWTVRSSGGDEKQITAAGISDNGFSLLPYNWQQAKNYSWSPDGGKIAYCSERSGQSNVWVISADGSSDTMISNNTNPNLNLVCPLWSPDGGRIACLMSAYEQGRTVRGVWVIEPGKIENIFQSDSPLRLVGWSASGNEVFVGLIEGESRYRQVATAISVLQVSAEEGGQQIVARLPPAYFDNIHLSPDGRNLAFAARRDDRDNIWVMPVSGGQARQITDNQDAKMYFSGIAWSPDGRALVFGKQTSWRMISMIDNFR